MILCWFTKEPNACDYAHWDGGWTVDVDEETGVAVTSWHLGYTRSPGFADEVRAVAKFVRKPRPTTKKGKRA